MQDQIISWGFNFAALVFFALVIYSTIALKKLSGTIFPGILFVVAAFIGNTDRIQSIRFSPTSGFEARAQAVIDKAQLTVDQLQRLASSLAKASLNQLAFSGMIFVGLSNPGKFEMRDQIIANLKNIGIKDTDLMRAQQIWVAVYGSMLEGIIEARVGEDTGNKDFMAEIIALRDGSENGPSPSPERMQKWISSKGVDDPKLEALLDDYKTLLTTGAMRNPGAIPFGMNPRATPSP